MTFASLLCNFHHSNTLISSHLKISSTLTLPNLSEAFDTAHHPLLLEIPPALAPKKIHVFLLLLLFAFPPTSLGGLNFFASPFLLFSLMILGPIPWLSAFLSSHSPGDLMQYIDFKCHLHANDSQMDSSKTPLFWTHPMNPTTYLNFLLGYRTDISNILPQISMFAYTHFQCSPHPAPNLFHP